MRPRHLVSISVSLCSWVIAGCGGTDSDLSPGAGESPGTGTSTLRVDGDIEARPRVNNAASVGDFDTHVDVRVELAGAIVSTGVVTVTTVDGSTELAFQPDRGTWGVTLTGYAEVFVLDVESGADLVEGVRVDGPDLHWFSQPISGATLDSRMVNMIAWTSEQRATSASIDTDEIDRTAIADTGSYALPAGALKADQDTPRENTVELTRTNRVTPAGAVAGSDVRVTVENRVAVLAQPDPTL